jgi:hypothetical protein
MLSIPKRALGTSLRGRAKASEGTGGKDHEAEGSEQER